MSDKKFPPFAAGYLYAISFLIVLIETFLLVATLAWGHPKVAGLALALLRFVGILVLSSSLCLLARLGIKPVSKGLACFGTALLFLWCVLHTYYKYF